MNGTRCGSAPWIFGVALATMFWITTATAPGAGGGGGGENWTGAWRATVNVNGTDVNFISVNGPDTFATFVEGQPVPFASGKLEMADGRWKTTPHAGPGDEGTYRFVDADTVSMTGRAGKEVVWKRIKVALPAGPPPGGVVVPPPAPVGGGGVAPAPAPDLNDFSAVRAAAKAMAGRWNGGALLFRADFWGAYKGSRFEPAGARLLYFSPRQNGAGFEVRIENGQTRGSRYTLDVGAAPQALPESALTPGEALRRLWDLAPTVRFDQVYLQLLRPGVEKPVAVDGDGEATSYPLASFLHGGFPVPFRDNETGAPKDRFVWRMAAVRDFDVVCDKAYGTFVYVDAECGQALSKRRPATGVQVFMRHGLTPPTPIQPFVFAAAGGPIPLDPATERVGTFDALAVAQKVEAMDLGLRLLVRDGRPDDEILRDIDKMCAWWEQVERARREDATGGIAAVEAAARENPKDVVRQEALLKRSVDEVERSKKAALASPLVVNIQFGNKKSEFWLGKQFEITPECLGTRNQTHMVLDTRTDEWIFKMEDPPHTRVVSRYYRKAVAAAAAIKALGRWDYDFERQLTRLRWLVGGNGAAIADEDAVSPIDPLQLMCLAEYERVRGSENMLEAKNLRLPKTWSTSSRRELGNGTVEITTTTYTRQPTADELAAADRLDVIANQQERPRVAQVQDLALKLQSPDPRIYYMWSRIEAAFYDKQLAERVVQRGLQLDPGSPELHAVRLIAWQENHNVNQAELYCVEKFSSPYTGADLTGGASLAQKDPWAGYFLSLQRLRVDPENVGSHAILCETLNKLSGLIINQQEAMPDAREQRQRELGVAALMMARLLDRPNEWQYAVPKGMPATRENVMKNTANLLALRGQDLATLKRDDQAHACFQKALALDPNCEMARKGMQ